MSCFMEVFGQNRQMQCAPVKITTNRYWVRLVGRRHDVQLWSPDDRIPKLNDFTRPYKPGGIAGTGLGASDDWISNIFEPIKQRYNLLAGTEILLRSKSKADAVYARMASLKPEMVLWDDPKYAIYRAKQGKKEKKLAEGEVPPPIEVTKSVREIVLFRARNVTHIYQVVEHGRRYYSFVTFSSDWRFSYHEMPPWEDIAKPVPVKFRYCAAEGPSEDSDFYDVRLPHSSLVVTRNLGGGADDIQTHVPAMFLRGLLPDVLVEQYSFWQNIDDTIIGYQKLEFQLKTKTAFALRIALGGSDDGGAAATVVRVQLHAVSTSSVPEEHAYQQYENEKKIAANDKSCVTLVNLMYAHADSPLGRLCDFIIKVETLAWLMVWAKGVLTPEEMTRTCQIATIELPRIGLTFFGKTDSDGTVRMYSSDNVGMFISEQSSPSLNKITEGIPHGILLESHEGDLALMVPAVIPRRVASSDDESFPTLAIFPPVYHEGKEKWTIAKQLSKMHAKHFLYPVHLSLGFIFTTTLSSSLYLLLLRFLHRNYEAAFRLADVCTTDTELSAEAALLFNQLSMLNDDGHPDAHAGSPLAYGCRIPSRMCSPIPSQPIPS